MSSTSMTTRIIIWIIAIAFMISSLGVSIAVIWQAMEDRNNVATQEEKPKLENFTPVAKVDKLQIIDTQPGTGAEVKLGDTLTLDYTGALAATGEIFESSKDTGQPVSFQLVEGGLIQGWVEGVPGMKEGGTRRIVIPSDKAYGIAGSQGIPSNSDLVFDITVHKIGE